MDKVVALSLQAPNIVVHSFGNQGTWTLIYNQGFEATVNGRTYFAFSYYTQVRNPLHPGQKSITPRSEIHYTQVRNPLHPGKKSTTPITNPLQLIRTLLQLVHFLYTV